MEFFKPTKMLREIISLFHVFVATAVGSEYFDNQQKYLIKKSEFSVTKQLFKNSYI